MAAKILSFFDAAFDNDPMVMEAEEIAANISASYPMVPVTLATHAAFMCLSKRALDKLDKYNWTDAPNAEVYLQVPQWETEVQLDTSLVSKSAPLGVILRLSNMLELPLPISLLGIEIDPEDDTDMYSITHTDTEEFIRIDGSQFDGSINDDDFMDDFSSEVRAEISEKPHKRAGERITLIEAFIRNIREIDKRDRVIHGIAGILAELFHGDTATVLFDKFSKLASDNDDDSTGDVLAQVLFDELEEPDKILFGSFEDFNEMFQSYGNYGEPPAPPSTDITLQRQLLAEMLSQEE
jgi:hypothetical protein